MKTLPALVLALATGLAARPTLAQSDLNDLEMAHVAVTASNIDISYAHLALALSDHPVIRSFAERMIRDHSTVNGQVAALAKRLNVVAQDNAMSRKLLVDAKGVRDDLSSKRGAEFDRAYAENELAYHRTVNSVVEDAFIPNIESADIMQAFRSALTVFRGHERRAEDMVRSVGGAR